MIQAWDYLLDPAGVPANSAVTIVGGGMVGLEAADLLTTRGSSATVIEALGHPARGMARNNRMELIERLEARGTKLYINTQVLKVEGTRLVVRAPNREGEEDANLEIGDCLMISIGPAANREVVPAVEEAGVEYALSGDAWRPGDFLTCVRDAWMLALSVDDRFRTRVGPP